MDILDTRPPAHLQRSNTCQGEGHTRLHQNDSDGDEEEVNEDTLLHEASSAGHEKDAANAVDQSSISSPSNKRKRVAKQDRADGLEISLSSCSPPKKRQQCSGSVARSVMPPTKLAPPSRNELAEIMILVERAMRLSVTSTGKSSSRVKIKANTFLEGLSDVAPVLWRPGYLAVG